MAAESLVIRQGVASGVPVAVIRLADRRPNVSAEQQEWAFQREVEAVLYGHGYSQQTGAVYRLLQRSGVRERALPLKKACIEQGLVTQLEFDSMYRHLSDVRSFTLIPLDALQTALATFGRSERSEALVAALGLERPDDWSDDANDAEGDDNDGGDDAKGEGDGDDDASDAGNDEGGEAGGDRADDESIAGTEVTDDPPEVGDEPSGDAPPTQASAAHDKGASDRRVAAAMKVVADYSANFTSGASSSTDPL